MKRRIAITAMMLLASAGVMLTWHSSRGHITGTVQDVTQPFEIRTEAPLGPFRNGALYVIATGHLDGESKIDIISNHGRDRQIETISGDFKEIQFGGPERWVGDLTVKFIPSTARTGEITLELFCGRNPPGGK